MNIFIKLNILFFPFTILISTVTRIPNRVSLSIVLLYLTFENRNKFVPYMLKNKYKLLLLGLLVTFIAFYLDVVFDELILFLSFPIYFKIYKYSDFLESDDLKKYFNYSTLLFIVIVVLSKIYTIYSLGFYDFTHNGYWWNKIIYMNLVDSIHGHPTYISMFILISLIFLLNQFIIKRSFFSKFNSAIVFIVQFSFLILLSVKITLLSIVIILFLFIIRTVKSRNSKTFYPVIIIVILITFTLINSLPSIKYRFKIDIETMQNKENIFDTNSKFSERLALWKSSIDLIYENPFVGTSLQNISSKDAIFLKAVQINSYIRIPKNSHNNFLEFGVRYGFAGFMLFLFLCIYSVYFGIKLDSFFILAISSVFIVFSFTESFLVREMGVMLLAMTIGLLFKELNDERSI